MKMMKDVSCVDANSLEVTLPNGTLYVLLVQTVVVTDVKLNSAHVFCEVCYNLSYVKTH